ncbi:hypothetical protein I79_020704 [Cricetulus griseus]|uniref:Uncharacterized protein n=1 Tax=Cricetulus griseus TaxID=10029 RepID=G3IAS5_CRIGR|nr:hypothetical protein I79_020704 [Cricetulus griseus]
MRELINPRDSSTFIWQLRRKRQHFQGRQHFNPTQCCLDTYGEQEAPENALESVTVLLSLNKI